MWGDACGSAAPPIRVRMMHGGGEGIKGHVEGGMGGRKSCYRWCQVAGGRKKQGRASQGRRGGGAGEGSRDRKRVTGRAGA